MIVFKGEEVREREEYGGVEETAGMWVCTPAHPFSGYITLNEGTLSQLVPPCFVYTVGAMAWAL